MVDPAQIRKAQPIPRNPGPSRLQQLQDWYPKKRPRPCPDTFEIALVLAGAVSAGSYTAGVMDFLFEALDEWHKHRCDLQNKDKLPNHNVVLRVIAGASAGGINGAIAAAACRYDFPPVTLTNFQQNGPKNPFYKTWVEEIDIRRLLDTSDIVANSPVTSLLNSKSLKDSALDIVDRKWGSPKSRSWLHDPFKLLLTVTNLRGVPYTVRFTGNTSLNHEMVMHRDHVGFSVPVSLKSQSTSTTPPDVLPLDPANSKTDPGWSSLADAALASGAFPVALAARCLLRPGSDYDYRFVFPHAQPPRTSPSVIFSKPKIDRNNPYAFTAVDGGAMNNEPFELARIELAGMKGHNPREGPEACRAVIMIDPFTDPRQNTKPAGSLWATFSALLKALKSQSRFKQIDLTLAEADDVYSRFMIAPSRLDESDCTVTGSRALASSGLDGFLGFFCKAYRHHDYMLGRRNCQRFLEEWFVLPSSRTTPGSRSSKKDNALFDNWPQFALRNSAYESQALQAPSSQKRRQIIPLVGTATIKQCQPAWPTGKFGGYKDFKQEIERRIDALYPQLENEIRKAFTQRTSKSSWFARNFPWLRRQIDNAKKDVKVWGVRQVVWKWEVRGMVHDEIKDRIDQARDDVDSRP